MSQEITSGHRAGYEIDGEQPDRILTVDSVAAVSNALREAADQNEAVCPIGLGAFRHIGGVPTRYDVALCTRSLDDIIDYQPTDMTINVGAGVSFSQLQAVLGEHGQWLPLDPPSPENATVGGVIAANLSGPCRLSQGTVRDFLIGIKVVRADGTLIKGGGRVVKNVAGYDLPKLFCGSFGTLGVIVEGTFMVRPRPAFRATFVLRCSSVERASAMALELAGSNLQPFFIEMANFFPSGSGFAETEKDSYNVYVGFAGIEEEVNYQRVGLQQMAYEKNCVVDEQSDDESAALALRLQNFPASGSPFLRCKISLKPADVGKFCAELESMSKMRETPVLILAHAGIGVIHCAFEDSPGSDEQILGLADWIRVQATQTQGYAVIEQISPALKQRANVWGSVGKAFPLMKRLKDTFDPKGILNPGRFVGGL